MGIKNIVHENHYPIIFIGSGIEKDILKTFQTGPLFWKTFGTK